MVTYYALWAALCALVRKRENEYNPPYPDFKLSDLLPYPRGELGTRQGAGGGLARFQIKISREDLLA